jgi:hypothetical protein
VLSHRSAAELWGILKGRSRRRTDIATPHLTRSTGSIRRRCLELSLGEMTVRRGIPTTTLVRTILDIASFLSAEGMEAAIREAEYLHRLRLSEVEEQVGLSQSTRYRNAQELSTAPRGGPAGSPPQQAGEPICVTARPH